MTISNATELERLRAIGRIVAQVLEAMGKAIEPGMTTAELDRLGETLLDRAGARSAPRADYGFPGATCISINEEVAHGIPGPRVIGAGDLVNIDVSAEMDGFYGDTGASFAVPPVDAAVKALCRDGRRAMWAGIRAVRAGRPLNEIGRSIEAFSAKKGYTLIRNLASHGVGRSLHEEPKEIATWYDQDDRRVMEEGSVFTIEPFLSTRSQWVDTGDDGWTLTMLDGGRAVQYEHTVVATRSGPLVLTVAQ
jgi:methionyl aminopeptidase